MAVPVFYINMKSRVDRKQFMESQLSNLDLSFERVEALTPGSAEHPGTISASDLKQFCNPENKHWVTGGELGCTLSHRKIWQTIVERNLQVALILEDDMVLSSSLPGALKALSEIDDALDIVKLETRLLDILLGKATSHLCGGTSLHYLHGYHYGAGAYVVSKAGARKLLQLHQHHDIPVDDFLFDPQGPVLSRLSVRQMVPAMAVSMGIKQPDNKTGHSDLKAEFLRRDEERQNRIQHMGAIKRFAVLNSRYLKEQIQKLINRLSFRTRNVTVAFADSTKPACQAASRQLESPR